MKLFYTLLFFFGLLLLAPQAAYAGSPPNVSDPLSTSHPATPAAHMITFTTATTIPSGGSISLTFSPLASSSASTFQLNSISDAQVKIFAGTSPISFTGTYTQSTTGLSPIISLNNINPAINAGNTLTIFLGCTAGSSGVCTTQAPMIINPTKIAAATTADIATLTITTKNSSGTTLDTDQTYVGTIGSVQTQAQILPSLSLTIIGIAPGTKINVTNNVGCTNSELTSLKTSASAATVTLGQLGTGITIAAQQLTVTTNATSGYALLAKSTGPFANTTTGSQIRSATIPAVFPTLGNWFGIHPCGLDVSSSVWGIGTTTRGSGAKYAWPTKTTSITIASDPTGPVGGTLTPGNGITSVEYAGAIDQTVPAGIYRSTITYTATPTF